MGERKVWTHEEDQLLRHLQQGIEDEPDGSRLKWSQMAAIVSQATNHHRTGKQCRERYHNQLKAGLSRQKGWSAQQQSILFQQQDILGNKWAAIAAHLKNRSDNNVKNYFYSTLRKAMRKVNIYVALRKREQRYKNVKEFRQQTLSKILTVGENKHQNKINVKRGDAGDLARDIRRRLVEVQRKGCEEDDLKEDYRDIMEIVDRIQEFNRICKKRKTKRKNTNQEDDNRRQEEREDIDMDMDMDMDMDVDVDVDMDNGRTKTLKGNSVVKETKGKERKTLINKEKPAKVRKGRIRKSIKGYPRRDNKMDEKSQLPFLRDMNYYIPKSSQNRDERLRDSSNMQPQSKSSQRRSSQSHNYSSSFKQYAADAPMDMLGDNFSLPEPKWPGMKLLEFIPNVEKKQSLLNEGMLASFWHEEEIGTHLVKNPISSMFESVNFTQQSPEFFRLGSNVEEDTMGLLKRVSNRLEVKRSFGSSK